MNSLLPELVNYIMGFLSNQTSLAWVCKKYLSFLTELKGISYILPNGYSRTDYLIYEPYNTNKLTLLETDWLEGSFNNLKTLNLSSPYDQGDFDFEFDFTFILPNLESISLSGYDIFLTAPKLEYIDLETGSVSGTFMKLKKANLCVPNDMTLVAGIVDHLWIGIDDHYDDEILAYISLDVLGIKNILSTNHFDLTFKKNDKPSGFKKSIYWDNLFVIEEALEIFD